MESLVADPSVTANDGFHTRSLDVRALDKRPTNDFKQTLRGFAGKQDRRGLLRR